MNIKDKILKVKIEKEYIEIKRWNNNIKDIWISVKEGKWIE